MKLTFICLLLALATFVISEGEGTTCSGGLNCKTCGRDGYCQECWGDHYLFDGACNSKASVYHCLYYVNPLSGKIGNTTASWGNRGKIYAQMPNLAYFGNCGLCGEGYALTNGFGDGNKSCIPMGVGSNCRQASMTGATFACASDVATLK